METPHQKTTLFPEEEAIFSVRDAKKAARTHAAETKAEKKQSERAEKAAKKIAKENADVAKRAQREQAEGAEKMRKLEKEAEKQRARREEQAANMEKKRRREEEKERVVEVNRYKRALGGMSWGFDPGAGTHSGRAPGGGSEGANPAAEGGASGEIEQTGFQRVRRGTTWGITSGQPKALHGSNGTRM